MFTLSAFSHGFPALHVVPVELAPEGEASDRWLLTPCRGHKASRENPNQGADSFHDEPPEDKLIGRKCVSREFLVIRLRGYCVPLETLLFAEAERGNSTPTRAPRQ